jgi:hypothetical protein
MTNEDKASPALRILIRSTIGTSTPGDGQSLRNIITNIYPDGACCFVNENRALYELDKESVAPADNISIVAPIAGPGRWILLAQGPGTAPLMEIVGTAENTVPSAGTVDFAAVNTANFDFEPTGTPAGYSLTALGGVITYNGSVPVRALARLDSSVYFPGGSGGLTPGAVDLGTAGNFTILAESGITNVPTSAITGDMGVSPIDHTAITGFSMTEDGSNQFWTSAQVTGKIYAADNAAPTPAMLTLAVTDMMTAYTDAAGRPADFTNEGAGSIGGLTLTPGVHKWTTGVNIASDVTLSGGPTDVFIMQISGTLSLLAAQSVVLSGGVLEKNVFWQVTTNVAIGAAANFQGIILSGTDIALVHGASMNGRLLSQTAVALDDNVVSAPGAVTSGIVWGVIAHNADVLGLDPAVSFLPGTEMTETGTATTPEILSSERLLLLSPGDTIQAAFATDSGSDITVTRATLSISL